MLCMALQQRNEMARSTHFIALINMRRKQNGNERVLNTFTNGVRTICETLQVSKGVRNSNTNRIIWVAPSEISSSNQSFETVIINCSDCPMLQVQVSALQSANRRPVSVTSNTSLATHTVSFEKASPRWSGDNTKWHELSDRSASISSEQADVLPAAPARL